VIPEMESLEREAGARSEEHRSERIRYRQIEPGGGTKLGGTGER